MTTGDYALDLASPVRHVAESLDRAAPAALSLGELAAGYTHFYGDLSRIRENEKVASDAEAVAWLIRKAVDELKVNGRTVQLIEADGKISLAAGVQAEDLKLGRKKVYELTPDPHRVLGDPFNPMSGKWSENVRKNTGRDYDLDDLRISMREVGWLPGHPAVRDKRTKVVITGHRRLKVAAELGIEPDYFDADFETGGKGDQADLARMDMAYLSNWGFKKLTPEERAEIAVYLKETRGLTQAEIAVGLGVSQRQVSTDLSKTKINRNTSKDLGTDTPETTPPATSKPRKPRANPKVTSPRKQDDPALHAEIRSRIAADKPLNIEQLRKQFEMGFGTVQLAVSAVKSALDAERAAAEQAAQREAAEPVAPVLPDTFEEEYQFILMTVMGWTPERWQRLVDDVQAVKE